jgi:hypothetical protein
MYGPVWYVVKARLTRVQLRAALGITELQRIPLYTDLDSHSCSSQPCAGRALCCHASCSYASNQQHLGFSSKPRVYLAGELWHSLVQVRCCLTKRSDWLGLEAKHEQFCFFHQVTQLLQVQLRHHSSLAPWDPPALSPAAPVHHHHASPLSKCSVNSKLWMR